jgi:lipopolysaccharide transport system permease protein
MFNIARSLYDYRELIFVLAWKNITVRYKQAYLGIAWALLKPVMLLLIFSLVKSFVGIETGDIPYPILTFAAIMPWVLFQESASEGVNSVTSNAALIKKIYFPRVVFPLTAMVTKLVELTISFFILAALMVIYEIPLTPSAIWVPVIILYTMLVALVVSLFGAAANVYYRDVSTALPVLLSLAMYASPVIYPLSLVKKTLLENQAAGEWSNFLFNLYITNPLAGIIDGFQHAMLKGLAPDWGTIFPGFVVTILVLPFSYYYFKKAEGRFADVI